MYGFFLPIQFFLLTLWMVPSGSLMEVRSSWARRLDFMSSIYSLRRACCSAFSASVRPVVLLLCASSLMRAIFYLVIEVFLRFGYVCDIIEQKALPLGELARERLRGQGC